MPDDKTKVRPQDASRVNVNEPYEVNYWCNKFGCSAAELRAAVAKAGVSATAVEKQLKGK